MMESPHRYGPLTLGTWRNDQGQRVLSLNVSALAALATVVLAIALVHADAGGEWFLLFAAAWAFFGTRKIPEGTKGDRVTALAVYFSLAVLVVCWGVWARLPASG